MKSINCKYFYRGSCIKLPLIKGFFFTRKAPCVEMASKVVCDIKVKNPRPKPPMPDKPISKTHLCTACGHGRNIVSWKDWTERRRVCGPQ